MTGSIPLPEPCLKPPCYAPEQCADQGYCTIRDTAESSRKRDASWKRRRAAKRKADLQPPTKAGKPERE
jgi:hypothetical protein